MQHRSNRNLLRALFSPEYLLTAPNYRLMTVSFVAATTLLMSVTASAQQSLVDRLSPIMDDLCADSGSAGFDPILGNSSCGANGGTPEEQAEVITELSGNAAAAAGSNASQTTVLWRYEISTLPAARTILMRSEPPRLELSMQLLKKKNSLSHRLP